MWADAHADRQEDSMNGTKLNSVVKAAFVAAAMFAATAAVASASAPSAEAAAGTSVLQAAGDSSGQLSLPIPAGETWTLTQGPHNTNGGAQNAVSPLSSLDLSGGSGHVVAARDGVVESVAAACRGETPAQANLVVINHGDGWHTSYYHIPNVQVVVGQHVARGQYLGNIGTGTGCGGSADGAHVHFSVEYYTSGSYSWQTGEVDLRGRSIGGWTFQGANWNGYAVRNSDGRTVYSGHNGLVDQVITGGGTPGSTSSSPSSVLDNHGNPVIYFRGTNNLLQQTHWVAGQGWVTDSPSDLPSGVAMAGDPTAVLDNQGNPIIYFRGTNNLLQQTHWVAGQGWVTDSNSGVAMAGNPSAVDAQGNPVIYFRGTNNLLQQTHWVAGQGWVTDSPSDLPSGVAMAGDPTAVLDNQGNPIIYFRGTNNLLQQTHWVAGQGWVTDSNSGVAMAGNPSAVDAQGNPVIYFRGTNNLLQQTHWVAGQGWVTDSPSDLPSGVAMAGDPTAVLDNQGNPIIYFRGTNNLLQQTHWVAGQGWVTDSNSGVAMAGNPSAVDAQGNPVIYFRGTNNLLQQTHWVAGQGWVTDSPSDLPSGVSF